MPVLTAYLAVIVIWSTTPLAIQWSGMVVGYQFGVALRMLIGLICLLLVVRVFNLGLPGDRPHISVYIAGGLPLFIAMSLVYWSAQSIPSGWISILFGLTPFFTSLLAALMLGEKSFTLAKTLGMLLGLAGLALVFSQSLVISDKAWLGVVGICIASLVHSLSSVLLKKLQTGAHPVTVTAGSLLIAVPLFIANSLLQGLPTEIPLKTLSAIGYLAIMGTAIGFPLYYYCLARLHAERVALITLITPLSALLLGSWLNGEAIGPRIWTGTLLVLGGLAIYEYGRYLPIQKTWIRWKRNPL